jgi:hypothetical protein
VRPVYVDGPLLGERFDTDVAFVQAAEVGRLFSTGRTVTYRFRQVAFAAGGNAVAVWVGWCGEREPDADVICRALFRGDVMERAEIVAVTPAPGVHALEGGRLP